MLGLVDPDCVVLMGTKELAGHISESLGADDPLTSTVEVAT